MYKAIISVCVLFLSACTSVPNKEADSTDPTESQISQGTIEIIVGGVEIEIPTPKGFQEVSTTHPYFSKTMEKFIPPVYRVVAFFISEDDFARLENDQNPKLERYMLVQVIRELEDSNITKYQSWQIINEIKSRSNTVAHDSAELYGRHLDSLLDEINNKAKLSIELQLDKPIILSEILDQADAFGRLSLSKMQSKYNNEVTNFTYAAGGLVIFTKRKIISTNVFSKYESSDDTVWINTISREWASSILSTND